MLFKEAFDAAVAGKYVQRKEWVDKGEYVVLMPGMLYLWKILTVPNPNAGNYLPFVADLLADDWEVVEKIEPAKV